MYSILQFFKWISSRIMIIGGVLLVGMVALTCCDVIGRMFGYPIFGAYELVTFMAAIVAAVALGDAHDGDRHVGVEIVYHKLPEKARDILDLITNFIAMILFFLVTVMMFLYGRSVMESGEVSMNLRLPEYLLIYVVGVGFLIFAVMIIKSIVDIFKRIRER